MRSERQRGVCAAGFINRTIDIDVAGLRAARTGGHADVGSCVQCRFNVGGADNGAVSSRDEIRIAGDVGVRARRLDGDVVGV